VLFRLQSWRNLFAFQSSTRKKPPCTPYITAHRKQTVTALGQRDAKRAQRSDETVSKKRALRSVELGSVRFGAAHPRRILSATQRTGDAHHQTRVTFLLRDRSHQFPFHPVAAQMLPARFSMPDRAPSYKPYTSDRDSTFSIATFMYSTDINKRTDRDPTFSIATFMYSTDINKRTDRDPTFSIATFMYNIDINKRARQNRGTRW
jgi:hypothetical protein